MQDNNKPPCICIGSIRDEHYVHIYLKTSRNQLGPFDTRIAAQWAAGKEADRLGIPRRPQK